MELPPLLHIPDKDFRSHLSSEQWADFLQCTLRVTDLHLQLPPELFREAAAPKGELEELLRTFYHELALDTGDATWTGPNVQKLKKSCFYLVHRICTDVKSTLAFLEFDFLADFCRVHMKRDALSRVMAEFWKEREQALQKSMQKKKSAILMGLDRKDNNQSLVDLKRLADIMLASQDTAVLFMTGSDFLDGLASAYAASTMPQLRKLITVTAYLGLSALVKIDPPNVSLLSDHLYGLKSQADENESSPSLLHELVTNTSLITKLRRSDVGGATERLHKLLDVLESYRTPSIARPRKRSSRPPNKDKGKAVQHHDEMHMHRMSLVTQIQDLFPDLGSGFILKLLDEYGDNVEQVTAHLLDDSLPPHLSALDRSEQASISAATPQEEVDRLVPKSTPPQDPYIPERRNVFDDDELDRLEHDTSKLHIGKRNEVPKDGQPNKAAILSALAAFDSDDDERDDTYDVEDVGGTIDAANPDGEPGTSAKTTQDENDMALFAAYKSSPQLFGRTFDVRKGQARQALKAETGMIDEAIEGWAIMLQRDPKRLKRLETRFGDSFDGKQTELAKTSYRDTTETDDSDAATADRDGFRGRGRGRGRGGRGRGGGVAGPSSDPSTANAQRKKEASKGSRANHNRRDQRAKKMARGGFAG